MVAEIKPIAELVGAHREYAKAAAYVDRPRPAAARRASSTTRRSPTTTRSSRRAPSTLEKMDADDRRIYDMVVRRFLAVFHPEAVFENTRVETTVREASGHVFRTRGKLLLVPGWRGSTTRCAERDARPRATRRTRAPTSSCRSWSADEQVADARDRERAQGNQAAAALQRRVAARRDGDRRQARRRRRAARGDEGLGHRHAGDARGDHRAADHVGYVERDGRALVATEKGLNVIRLLGEHALTSPDLTGELGASARARSSAARTRARSS